METIPQDIQAAIVSFLDDKAKRQMRLANTKWFSIIKYNNFNIYFTRKEDIPAITERFSKYSWLIKLGFVKPKFSDGLDIIDYLPKLTNLIELSTWHSIIDFEEVTRDQWQRLSTLSNLQVCGALTEDLPRNLWHNYTKLTEWLLTAPEAKLAPILKQMSHLESLRFFDDSTTWPYALIPYPEKLTRLIMSVPTPLEHGNEMCSKLTNLKELQFYNYNDVQCIDLTYATSLEKCYIKCDTLPSLATNTNLTHLEAEGRKWTLKNSEDVAKLSKLQILKFTMPSLQEEPVEFNFLSHLNQLQKFELDNDKQLDTTGIIDRIYEYLPRGLKSLTVDADVDLVRLVDLDLEELVIKKSIINSQYLSAFSNLTSLSICHHKDVDLNSIYGLTKLEDLTLNFAIEEEATSENYNCELLLSGLTNLTSLALHSKFEKESFWNIISQLTKIQRLKMTEIDNDDRLLQLTSFKNLTELTINSAPKEFTGIHFTALTNLQYLNVWFRGKGARSVHNEKDLERTMPYLINCLFLTE